MAGKRYVQDRKKVDAEKTHSLQQALEILDGFSKAKFDETVDVVFCLGIDAKQTDQAVRGAVSMPHGLGKKVRVAVFAKGEKAADAEKAGADVVGAEDLAKRVEEGFMDFDQVIATPDMMAVVGKLGKVLGPRGLMPNPKTGTVTQDVVKAVAEAKAGRVEFRIDKNAIIHAPVGKRSFGPSKLADNIIALLDAVNKAKPAAAKGTYIKNMYLSATMTPSVKVDAETCVKA